VLVNHTVKTVFDSLLARTCGDGESSDEDAVSHIQVCCFFVLQLEFLFDLFDPTV